MHQFLSLAHVLGSKQALQFIPDIGEYEYFLYYSAPGKDNYYKQNQMKIWEYFMIHFHYKKKKKESLLALEQWGQIHTWGNMTDISRALQLILPMGSTRK